MATSSSVVKEIKIIVNGGQATASIDGVTVSTKKLNSELVKLSQNAGKGKAGGASGATGGATATVLELGRTISDSNYGIRGMANNLSQLASNFVFTTRAAGGFGAGLKSIWSAMMGPLGLVLAFQGVIALLERWSMRAKDAEEATDELMKAVGSSASNLKILKDTLDKNLLSQEDSNKAVEKANKEYEGLNISLDENNKLTDDSKIAIDNKILSLEKLSRALALQKLIEEKYTELLPLEIEQTKLDTDEKLKNARALSALSSSYKENGIAVAESAASRARGVAQEGREAINVLKEELNDLLKLAGDEGLVEKMFKGDEQKKSRSKKTKKTTDQEFDFPTGEGVFWTTEDYNTAMQLDFDMTQRYLDSRRVFSDEQRVLNQEENLKLLNDQILHQENITVLEAEGSIERLEAESILSMMRMDLQDAELQHELDTIEAKKNAQMQYVNFAGQLGGILGNIAGKNKELATAALVVEKGAAIAGVVVQASASIAQRTAANAAIPAFLPIGVPNPAYITDSLFMAKDIARTKISAGISIAAILASAVSGGKKNVPSSRGRGGTPSAGGGDRTFDFNLVGSTGTNQLAEAVGSQFQEPVQAYVVSSQMTSQQELDLQISTGASLGGD